MALDTLRSRKVRSALTMLGIVIGVTSVISVASIIDGLNGYHQGPNRGRRIAPVHRDAHSVRHESVQRPPQKMRSRKYLQVEDAAFLREALPAVAYAATFADRFSFGGTGVQNDIRYGKQLVERFFLRGVGAGFRPCRSPIRRGSGAVHHADDEEHAAPSS